MTGNVLLRNVRPRVSVRRLGRCLDELSVDAAGRQRYSRRPLRAEGILLPHRARLSGQSEALKLPNWESET